MARTEFRIIRNDFQDKFKDNKNELRSTKILLATVDCNRLLNNNNTSFVMRCAIWYHLYNFKNMKNTHGGVSILVKLQA